MALANFFGKNALAAHQLLGGMTPETLDGVLGAHVVGVLFDGAAASSREGRLTATLTVNLAARLYPRMAVLALGGDDISSGLRDDLESLARLINPDIDLCGDAEAVTAAVVLGETRQEGKPFTVYAGSRGWNAAISPATPRGSGDTQNPFGAGASACFALANVFRHVFREYLPEADADPEFTLSLYDYGRDDTGEGGPALGNEAIRLGETILAGVGAVGNATVWALAHTPRVEGVLHLVDFETVGLMNLQRYVLAVQADAAARTPKVALAADFLRASQHDRGEDGLVVEPHPYRWGEFLARRGNWRLERVLTAFDTKADRVAAQAALPRRLLNAWTQLGDLGVSRHLAFGQSPCVACLYRPKAGGKSEAELIGEAMGQPGAPEHIKRMLHTREPIGEDFIRGVAQNRGITSEDALNRLLEFAAGSLQEFYNDAFCGGVILQMGGKADTEAERVEAPMAFQSVLAGIMLAAETVIDAQRTSGSRLPAVRTVIDLLRPLRPHLHQPAGRRKDGLCLCNDPDYLDAYASKYQDAA